MNEYEVTFVYETVNVTTIVWADDVERAAARAAVNVHQELGFDGSDCAEVVIEHTGTLGRGY